MRRCTQAGFAELNVLAILAVGIFTVIGTASMRTMTSVIDNEFHAVHDLRVVEIQGDNVVLKSRSDRKSEDVEGVVVKGEFVGDPRDAQLSLIREDAGGMQKGPLRLCNWNTGVCQEVKLKTDGKWHLALDEAPRSRQKLFCSNGTGQLVGWCDEGH